MDLPKETRNTKNVVKKVLITPEQIAKLGLTAKIQSVVAPQLKQKINLKPVHKKQTENVSINKVIKNHDKQNQDEMTTKIKSRLKELIGTKLSASQIANQKEESNDILLDEPSGSNTILSDNKNSSQTYNQDVKEQSQRSQASIFPLNLPSGNNINLNPTQMLNVKTTTKNLQQKNNERGIEERSKITVFQNQKVFLNRSTVENLLKSQESGAAITSKGVITLHATKKKGSVKLKTMQTTEQRDVLPSFSSLQKSTSDKSNILDKNKTDGTKTKEISTMRQNTNENNYLKKCLPENNLESQISSEKATSTMNCNNNLVIDGLNKGQKDFELSDNDKSLNMSEKNNSLNCTSADQINSSELAINLIQRKMLVDDIKEEGVNKIADTSANKETIGEKLRNNFNLITKTSHTQDESTIDTSDENSDQCDNLIKSDSRECIINEPNKTKQKQNKTHIENSAEVDKEQTCKQNENIKSMDCLDSISLNTNDGIINIVTTNDETEKNTTEQNEQHISIIHKRSDEQLKIIDNTEVCKQNEDILDDDLSGIEAFSENENIEECEESSKKVISNIVGTKKKVTKWKSKMLDQTNYEKNKLINSRNEQIDTSTIDNNQVSTINSSKNKHIDEISVKLFPDKNKLLEKEDLVNISKECINDSGKSKSLETKKNFRKTHKETIVDESNKIPLTPETKICQLITSTPNENHKLNFSAAESDSSIIKTLSTKKERKKLKDMRIERGNNFQNMERPKRATKLPKRFLVDNIKNDKAELLIENGNNYLKTQGCKRKFLKHNIADGDGGGDELVGIQLPEELLENKEKKQKQETLSNEDTLNSEISGDADLQDTIKNIKKIKKDVSSKKSGMLISPDNIDSLNISEIYENIIMKRDKQIETHESNNIELKSNEEVIDTSEINKNVEKNCINSANPSQTTSVTSNEMISSKAINANDNSMQVPKKRRGRPPKHSKNLIENITSNSNEVNNKSIETVQENMVDKNNIEISLIEDNSNNRKGDKVTTKLINEDPGIPNMDSKENVAYDRKNEDNSNIKISTSTNEMGKYTKSSDSSHDKDIIIATNKNETCNDDVPVIIEKKKRGRPSKSNIPIITLPDLGKRKKEKVDYAYLDGNVDSSEFVKKRRISKRITENLSKDEGVINELAISKDVTCNNANPPQGVIKRKRGRASKKHTAFSKEEIEPKIEEDSSLSVAKTDMANPGTDLLIKTEQSNNLSLDGDVDEFIRQLRTNQKLLYEELQSKLAGQLDGRSPLEIHQGILVTAFAVDMRQEIERNKIKKLKEKPGSVKKPDKTITCAVCYGDLPNSSWTIHRKRYHNSLAWKVGETPIDFTNVTEVLYILNQFYKDRKPLYCSTCSESKKSPIGFLCHKMICNKTEEMLEEMKIACHICTKRIMPFSLIEHMKGHKTKEEKNQKIQKENHSDEINVSGKRNAAVRASRIIQDALKDSVATTPNSIKKLYTKNISVIKYDESKVVEDINQNGFTKCTAEECGKEAKSTEEASDHFANCQFNTKKTYLCKNCDYICRAKEEICSHIETQHKSLLPPEMAEYNMTSDTEDEDTSSLQKRSHNKTVATGKIYQFRFLSEKPHIEDFSHHLNKLTFMKTLAFCSKNYESSLFMNLSFNQSDWSSIDAERILGYLPILKKSLPVEQEQNKTISFTQKNLKKPKRYKLFESTLSENGTSTAFCGGPISSMAWLPTPIDNKSCDQILAISVLPDSNRKYHILRQHSGKNAVQFWNYGCLSNENTSTFKPKLEFCLAHEYGVIWTMEWCPSGCFNKERMGLLAVSSSDSNVYLYSVCHPDQLSSIVYKVKPVLQLSLERKTDLNLGGVPYQATKISWSKAKGHKYISVGFSNGIIALYNLESCSELLQDIKNDINVIYPWLVFQAHQSMVTGISLYHLNNGRRWLATSSCDRQIKFWDLENVVEPISSNVRYPISGIVWLNNWLSAIDAHDDVTNCMYQATSVCHIKEFLHGNSILYSNSPVNAISGSNWSNIIVQGNVMGEVIGGYLKQFAPLIGETNLCRYYMSYTKLSSNSTASSAASKSNNDPSEISTYTNKSKHHGLIFCDMNLKNYDIVINSKLITGHRGKYQDYDLFSYPIQSISSIEINPNRYSFLHTAVGYQAGFVKLLHTKFLSS